MFSLPRFPKKPGILGCATLFLLLPNLFALEKPVDWPAFLRPHDMLFNKLPQNWTEAPHFGNAMIGSMIYQNGDAIQLQIFHADVHDHRDTTWGWTAYSRPRMEIGHFLLHTLGKPTACQWRKDLWNAELTGTITTDKGTIHIRHLTHAVDMAIVTELTPDAGEKDFRWTWHPAEARTTRPGYPKDQAGLDDFAKRYGGHYRNTLKFPWKPNPPGRLEQHGAVSLWAQDLLAGGQYATAWSERTQGGTRTHIATIVNSHPSSKAGKAATANITRFLQLDPETWRASHHAWWHNYYPLGYISLPDKSLEALYWQTIYRFGCTSRSGRGFVDTAGLWFQGKSWPYFTSNWNIQSAHWPVYTANRLDQGRELVDRLHKHQATLVDNVRPVEWQSDSAFLALAIAGDLRGHREEDMRYHMLVGNLPWVLHNVWWQYRYSMDESVLRDTLFPLLRRAVNLYLHLIIEEADGTLRLPPTYSPETSVVANANFDLSLLKWACHILLKSSKRLGIEDPLIPRWREVIRRLPDFPKDEHGFRLGSEITSPTNHRHLSHLLMIYPLHLVNIDQPGTAEVLKNSFQRGLNSTDFGKLKAMVQTHAGPIGAAIGDGDGTLKSLQMLRDDLYPNGLWHESPCIESTLGAATIIQDMLLQSWSDPAKDEPGIIRVFPALPSTWQDVEFHNLRTEGAFLVSAQRSKGKTEWIRIRSLAGEPCFVKTDMIHPIRSEADRQKILPTAAPDTYEIKLAKGESILLLPKGGDPGMPER